MTISCYYNSGVARLESCITWEVIYIWWLTSWFSSARYNYVSGKGITRASLEIQLQFCSAWTQNKFSKFYKILSVLNKIMQKLLWLCLFCGRKCSVVSAGRTVSVSKVSCYFEQHFTWIVWTTHQCCESSTSVFTFTSLLLVLDPSLVNSPCVPADGFCHLS